MLAPMRAVWVESPGRPEVLKVREIDAPSPASNQVLIDVQAASLNRADLLQRRGLYPPPSGTTPILGLECAGTVSQLGDDVRRTRLGDRVMTLLAGGGYAEQVCVHESLLIPIPSKLSFVEAAAIPEAFLTAQEALFSLGNLQPNQTVLVHAAAGGVGSAAVQLARQVGAEVFASVGSMEKANFVTTLGAQHVIQYRTEAFDEVIGLHAARGVDVIVDFIGAKYIEQHIDCLAPGGRLVVVGLLGGSKAQMDLGKLLHKRLQILGLIMRTRSIADKAAISRHFIRHSLPLFDDGRLRPIIDCTFPLRDVALAHERMEQNLNIGKIVLTVGRAAESTPAPA